MFPKDFIDWWIASRGKEQHRSHTRSSSPLVSLITASGQQATDRQTKKTSFPGYIPQPYSPPTVFEKNYRTSFEKENRVLENGVLLEIHPSSQIFP